MFIELTALGLLAASPTAPAHSNAPTIEAEQPAKSKTPDFGEMLKMMDKIFPPQPEPDPARLALSRISVQGLLPDGTYGRAMSGMLDSFGTRILGMSDADFGKKGKGGKEPSTETLHQKLLRDDPHFDERMTIIKRIATEELERLSTIIEPRMREGLARSMARRFDEKQLADLNTFLATDSGKAYGRQSMAMWVDPDLIRSLMTSVPDLIMAVPGIAARIDKETAHLPKPKKSKPAAAADKKE